MKTKSKKATKKSAPRKRLTSERPLKNRPVDPEPPEAAESEKRKPRQARLPQMEDPAIEELETAAEEYASIRDQRQALTPEEVRLKGILLQLMEKHGKESYEHDGYSIKVVVESKKVRVRIKRDDNKE